MRHFEKLESLHQRCKIGDADAEQEIAKIIHAYGYDFAMNYFSFKKHLANDFAQEFYLAYAEHRNGIIDIHFWLLGVSAKLASSFLRKDYRWKRGVDLSQEWYYENEKGSPEQQIIDRLHLWNEMQVFDRRERLIIYLRVWKDLPFEKIGRKLHLQTDNAKRIYHRALKKLAAQLVSPPLSPTVR